MYTLCFFFCVVVHVFCDNLVVHNTHTHNVWCAESSLFVLCCLLLLFFFCTLRTKGVRDATRRAHGGRTCATHCARCIRCIRWMMFPWRSARDRASFSPCTRCARIAGYYVGIQHHTHSSKWTYFSSLRSTCGHRDMRYIECIIRMRCTRKHTHSHTHRPTYTHLGF